MAESKKGSATTEVFIGKAAAKLTSGVAALKEAAGIIEELTSKSADLSVEIASKEDRNAQLDVEYNEKLRSKQVELKLQVQADEAAVAEKYASANNKEIVDKKVREREQQELADLNDNFDEKLAKQVQQATSAMSSNHKNELALKEAEFRAKEAQNTATIQSQNTVIGSLERQVESLNKQIEAERAASVERAKAQGSSVVNVSGQGR